MELDGGKGEFTGNFSVLDSLGLLQSHALDVLGDEGGGSNGTSTTKGLESGFGDLARVIHLDLEFHNVPAGRGAHETSANVQILLVKGPNVPGGVVVIKDFFVVLSPRGGGKERGRGEDGPASRGGGHGRKERGGRGGDKGPPGKGDEGLTDHAAGRGREDREEEEGKRKRAE